MRDIGGDDEEAAGGVFPELGLVERLAFSVQERAREHRDLEILRMRVGQERRIRFEPHTHDKRLRFPRVSDDHRRFDSTRQTFRPHKLLRGNADRLRMNQGHGGEPRDCYAQQYRKNQSLVTSPRRRGSSARNEAGRMEPYLASAREVREPEAGGGHALQQRTPACRGSTLHTDSSRHCNRLAAAPGSRRTSPALQRRSARMPRPGHRASEHSLEGEPGSPAGGRDRAYRPRGAPPPLAFFPPAWRWRAGCSSSWSPLSHRPTCRFRRKEDARREGEPPPGSSGSRRRHRRDRLPALGTMLHVGVIRIRARAEIPVALLRRSNQRVVGRRIVVVVRQRRRVIPVERDSDADEHGRAPRNEMTTRHKNPAAGDEMTTWGEMTARDKMPATRKMGSGVPKASRAPAG